MSTHSQDLKPRLPVESPEIKPAWITLRAHRIPLSFKLDRRVPLITLLIAIFTFVVIVISVSTGEYDINPIEVVQTIFGTLNPDHPDARNFTLVVHTFRLPRIFVAFLVGAALAVSGVIMQGITRNPLADPGILGVSAGASVAAVTLIVLLQNVPFSVIPFAAFGGALLTAGAIYILAFKGGGAAPTRLILIGVAFAAVLESAVSYMLVVGDIYDVQQAYLWLTGSVYGRNWEHVKTLGVWLLVLFPIVMLSARHLNALSLGDDVAKGFGLRVEARRGLLLVLSVALAAASVAVAGTIGFVGLVAPHIARRLVGGAHEGLIPVAALFGGALLVLADLVGRWIIAPSELPIGIVTAVIGAPYFLYLLYRSRNQNLHT